MRKKILAMLLAVVMAAGLLPATAFAAETSGSCGENVTWTYSDGVLTIQGTGPMDDYELRNYFDGYSQQIRCTQPWVDFCSDIHTVIIGDDVTSIGSYAIFTCSSLTNATIPDSVTSIGSSAFAGCSSLTEVYYGGSKSQWEQVTIDYYNDPLLSANIHYNSTGPEPEDPGVTEDPDVTFTDVAKTAWFYDDLQWAVKNGWVNGYPDGTFLPEDDCSEEQILVLLYRAAGSPASDAPLPDGIADGQWYSDALRWAMEKGMIDSTFQRGTPGARARTIYLLWLANGSQSAGSKVSFTDVAEDAYYIDALSWAVEEGIVTGYPDGTFAPGGPFQRAHLVRLLHLTVDPEARG